MRFYLEHDPSVTFDDIDMVVRGEVEGRLAFFPRLSPSTAVSPSQFSTDGTPIERTFSISSSQTSALRAFSQSTTFAPYWITPSRFDLGAVVGIMIVAWTIKAGVDRFFADEAICHNTTAGALISGLQRERYSRNQGTAHSLSEISRRMRKHPQLLGRWRGRV